jgi:prepilin-type N-terminal cleavage/methylation domain-containing protein
MRKCLTIPSLSSRSGVTLIEVLVVIGLIGILIALLLPAVQQVRNNAIRLDCLNRMKQVGLGVHGFHDTHGRVPPDWTPYLYGTPNSKIRGVSWLAHILPFVEQDALWERTLQAYQIDLVPYHNPPHVGLATVIRTYTCPADSRLLAPYTDSTGHTAAYTSYLGVEGSSAGREDGVLTYEVGIRFTDITDGMTQTIMIGEWPPIFSRVIISGWWYTVHPGSDRDFLLSATSPIDLNLPPYCPTFPSFGPGRLDNPCD